MWHDSFRKALEEGYSQSRRRNPRYSLRAYALKIGLSSSALSEVLNGKRKVSREKAIEIVNRLPLRPAKKDGVLDLVRSKSVSERPVMSGQERVLSDWVYLAVLHFFDLDHAHFGPTAISERLSVPIEKIEKVLMDLLELKLLVKDGDGRIRRDGENWKTSDGVSSEAVRQFHFQGFDLARRAMLEVPMQERDMTSLVFVGDPAALEAARAKIREVYQEVVSTMMSSERTELYRMSVSLYPMTRKK